MNVNPRTMTVPEFEAAVAKVVEEHPDWRNPYDGIAGVGPCMYLKEGRSCLIGYVLLHEFEAAYSSTWENHGAHFPMADLGFSRPVIAAAAVIQSIADQFDPDAQDKRTWADAWDRYLHSPDRIA